MAEPQGRDLNLASARELQGLQTQLQEDLQSLNANFASLKVAQAKFLASADAVAALAAESAASNRDTLIPLTSSLYVPARLVKDAELLVDIGTSFFVGKKAADAREVLLKKAALLKSNTDGLAKVIANKQSNLETVNEVLLSRKMQMQARQQVTAQQLPQP